MRLRDAKREFEKLLREQSPPWHLRGPRDMVSAMIIFYRDLRAEDCRFESDGDMLLFQFGTYDWGNGPRFEFDVTRQLIAEGQR
jgi:hypothetical protein